MPQSGEEDAYAEPTGGAEPSPDAGLAPPVDEHAEDYLEWFAFYNDGQGTGYLDDTGLVLEEGDQVNLTDPPPHVFVQGASYGPFSRNIIDVYMPTDVDAPTPIAVYIHGGGFTSGDKEKLHEGKANVEQYLADGIAVATISYRYGSQTDELARAALTPNGECDGMPDPGCRKDVIFRDGARAIQYLRYRAEDFNIDPERIGVWGSSAGGQIALWIGTTPDLADAERSDPVLRESTRVHVVGHQTSQVSPSLSRWPALLPFSDAFWDALSWDEVSYDRGLHMTFDALENEAEGRRLFSVVDYLGAMSEDDPPTITTCTVGDKTEGEMLDPANADDFQSWFVHHPAHSTPVYNRCLSVQAHCEIATAILLEGEVVRGTLNSAENTQAFLTRWLLQAD